MREQSRNLDLTLPLEQPDEPIVGYRTWMVNRKNEIAGWPIGKAPRAKIRNRFASEIMGAIIIMMPISYFFLGIAGLLEWILFGFHSVDLIFSLLIFAGVTLMVAWIKYAKPPVLHKHSGPPCHHNMCSGYYAYATREQAEKYIDMWIAERARINAFFGFRYVIGEVYLWGIVEEWTKGYKAEYAYPKVFYDEPELTERYIVKS